MKCRISDWYVRLTPGFCQSS